LAATFHCKAGYFPFTYLGLPLGLSKPNAQDCFPLVQRIERRLVNTCRFCFPLNGTFNCLYRLFPARHIKRQLKVPSVMEIIIILCWSIWTERNSWLFRNEDPSVDSCKATFKREMDLVIHRSKTKYTQDMKQWLDNLA
jgi:hypothetical protein